MGSYTNILTTMTICGLADNQWKTETFLKKAAAIRLEISK